MKQGPSITRISKGGATILGVLVLLLVQHLHADEIVVTSSSPTGEGSLSEAIALTLVSEGPDTITFDPSVTTIFFESNIQDVNAADPVIIDGGGTVTLDGTDTNNGTSGLEITTGGHTIRGLTIKNFDAEQILVTGNGVNIENCTIIGGGDDGIEVTGDGVEIVGCYIGTDGSNALGNGRSGINLVGVASALIGDTSPEDRNVISGNSNYGIELSNASSVIRIRGNYIGTNAAGNAAIGNGLGGIRILNTPDANIGGTSSDSINLISGNAGTGIQITGSTSSGFIIRGNLIGTDISGLVAMGNSFSGISISNAGSGLIGGATDGARNVIAANGVYGIQISGLTATLTDVQNNYIGVGADGTTVMGNASDGVIIVNSKSILVGGLEENEGNIISGNDVNGIFLSDATECLIFGNRIGVNANDEAAGNGQNGIAIQAQSDRTQIGNEDAPNTIANNGAAGVILTASDENTISRNSIYGNTDDGIALSGANGFVRAPVITQLASVRGTSSAMGTVEIFVDDEDEGRIWIATTEVDEEGGFYSPVDLAPYTGMYVTATVTDGSGNTSAFSSPVLIEDLGQGIHTADQDGDYTINISELLRVIQFFNSSNYGCEEGTEDGFDPNDPDQDCMPHSSDYNPQDWTISISELLRLIQFYNSGGFHYCPDADPATEDGFCPGVE